MDSPVPVLWQCHVMKQRLSKLFRLNLVVWLLGCAACTSPAQSAALNEGTPSISQMTPPPPAPVPPNASRITATVRKYTVWPPGSFAKALPPVSSDQTLYSLTLKIDTSQAESSGLDSLAVPGSVIEAFSEAPLPSNLAGKQIEATVRMTGDTRGVRWQISKIIPLS